MCFAVVSHGKGAKTNEISVISSWPRNGTKYGPRALHKAPPIRDIGGVFAFVCSAAATLFWPSVNQRGTEVKNIKKYDL